MIYISIPQDWTFDGTNYDSDVFVNTASETTRTIPLQELIKDCLRTKQRHATSVSLNNKETHNETITIYFKLPPNTDDFFIQYEPQRNGKEKSTHARPVKGNNVQGIKLKHVDGLLWHQIAENRVRLTEERLAELEQKSEEQAENRRHTGDSPLAT